MNRFEYAQAVLRDDESFVAKHKSMKLYHGHQKVNCKMKNDEIHLQNKIKKRVSIVLQTNFEDGEIVLTTHRLLWGRVGEIARGMIVLNLNLKYVISLDEEMASSFVFGRKKRIIITLKEPTPDKAPGPMDDSTGEIFIKLSGRNGIEDAFVQSLNETINARIWETSDNQQATDGEQETSAPRIKLRTGIVGIERSLQERQKQTDENITLAFKDLSKLMTMAKDMVAISKVISSKIRERHGEISEDETVRFKSYLMSLGIDDPVTRNSAASNSEYFQLLANQICEMLLDPITVAGGMMSLADVYCRVNRARGLELLSPEDLLNACQMLDGPIKLRTFPSGAMVLQLESHSDETVSQETFEAVSLCLHELFHFDSLKERRKIRNKLKNVYFFFCSNHRWNKQNH